MAPRTLTAILLTLCAATALAQSVDEPNTRLTFPDNQILLTLPILNTTSATTQITAEILDPQNQPATQATAPCHLTAPRTLCRITLPPTRDHNAYLNNHYRLRYTLSNPALTGILALDHIAPDLFELHAAAPSRIRLSSDLTIRIRALHPLTHIPRANVPLTVTPTLSYFEPDKDDEDQPPQSIVTDAGGFATFTLHIPSSPDLDSIDLAIDSNLAGFSLGTSLTLHIPTTPRFDLTTDKPLYQPGQTVHTRLLLLDRNGHATPATNVRVDIHDPDSTLVFRAQATTSAFGIATIDWPVPDRMRLGQYTLEADVPDADNNTQTASASIRLSRYDLPTFVVSPTPDRPFYLPNQNATVNVHADYLFGKPVLHGRVRVVREDDRTWNFAKQRYDTKEGRSVSGSLDPKGHFLAHIDLTPDLKPYRDPDSRDNQYQDLHFAAYLTDASTRRTEQRRFDLRIASQSLHLYLIAGTLARDLPQQYYLAATLADGTPTPRRHRHRHPPPRLPQRNRDPGHPPRPHPPAPPHRRQRPRPPHPPYLATAHQPHASRHIPRSAARAIRRPRPLPRRPRRPKPHRRHHQIPKLPLPALRHPHQPIPLPPRRPHHPHHRLRATIRPHHPPGHPPDHPRRAPPRHPQPHPRPRPRRPHPPHRLPLHRPRLPPDHQPRRQRQRNHPLPSHPLPPRQFPPRLAPDGLRHLQTRRRSHRHPRRPRRAGPRRRRRTPAPSALGLVAVDQAVNERNRTDNDFGGNSQSFFFRNWYDYSYARPAGGFTLPALEQLDLTKPIPDTTQLAAEIILSNQSLPFEEVDNTPNPNLYAVFQNLLDGQLNPIRIALQHFFNPTIDPTTKSSVPHSSPPSGDEWDVSSLQAQSGIDLSTLRDPWDRPFTPIITFNSYGGANLELRSDGPDKLPNTADDFTISLTAWRWFAEHQRQLQHAVTAYHQRTGRYLRTLVDLRDEMRTESIPFDQWRDPWNQPFTYTFPIQGPKYTILTFTRGDPHPDRNNNFGPGPYNVGTAYIDYTKDLQQRIDEALNHYVQSHPFPSNAAQFQAVLRAAHITPAQMLDPWNQPIYATFRTHSFFTDRVHTEAHAVPDGPPQLRTTTTPVTAISDIIDLHSHGQPLPLCTSAPSGPKARHIPAWAEGPGGPCRRIQSAEGATHNTASNHQGVSSSKIAIQTHPNDFVIASLSHVRSTQSAKEATASHPGRQIVFNGPTGSITGTVTDPSGAIIPNATVVATNLRISSFEFQGKSDEQGRFLLGPMPAGSYKLHLSMPGFTDLIYDQVEVLARNTVTLDARLNVGSESQTVEVTANQVELQTMNAAVGVVMNQAQISGLPINGRDISVFAALQPGVVSGGLMGGRIDKRETATPRLRDYFPETLLWRPEIITDPNGAATVHFPVADNITTWQLSAAASTLQGNTGAGTTQFRTFQPFFAAFDPPSILTTGDTIALPITLRNYLDHPLTVTSSLTPAPWFKLTAPATQTTQVRSGDSASPIFRFTATTPITNAQQEFTSTGVPQVSPLRPGSAEGGDRISRPVTVHPNGLESAVTTASILTPGANTLTFTLPPDTLTNSTVASIRLYPNLAAHFRDALAAMAHYPNGCAEQILSTAWPSLLLQRYATAIPQKDTRLLDQTHLYLEEAYENLLGNQLPSGGFAYWTTDHDADLALTAYAIQFLQQARDFITIDDKIIAKAVDYLARQQQKDGRWIRVDRDSKPHPEDTRANAMLTASIASMIANAPKTEPLLTKALAALQPFVTQYDEPYTLASYVIALTAVQQAAKGSVVIGTVPSEVSIDSAVTRLRTLALTENGGAYWSLETNTPFFGWGRAGRVESTSQVLRALLAAGAKPNDDLVTRGLLFLNHEQDRQSLWYSTQATARVLDVMASIALGVGVPQVSPLRPGSAAGGGNPPALTLTLDNTPQPSIPLPAATEDAGPITIPLGTQLTPGPHTVTLTLPQSASNATAQLVADLYRPWPKPSAFTTVNNEQLRLTLAFSSTNPTPGKPIAATAHIERLGFRGYGMMIAELGLPPGADVDRASLESAMTSSNGQLNHYEVLPDRVLLYLWPHAGGLTLHFAFTPRYGVDALTAPSTLYDYYNPDSRLDLPPTHFHSW